MFKNTLTNVFLIGLMLAMVALPARQARAAPATVTIKVNSTLDVPDDLKAIGTCETAPGNGICTLRAAIMQANRTSGEGAIIQVPSGVYSLTIPAAPGDGEENGDLNLTTPAPGTSPQINIQGDGADTTIIDANTLDRVFKIETGRTASISGVTIRNGFLVSTGGGGIYNVGMLTVSDSTVSGNHSFYGGGIYNESSLTVINSTISLNNSGSGAGIYNNSSLTLSNSTISVNNSTSFGGGIDNDGKLDMSGSTVSFNNATDNGGGIYNQSVLAIWNSTISGNSANISGGGIYNGFSTLGGANVYNVSIVFNSAGYSGNGSAGGVYNDPTATFNLRNTLLAGNNVSNLYNDCTGSLNSYGRNLYWSVTGCTVTDRLGGKSYPLDALNTLGPLQNNGGPTWTVALLPGSNAIDGGDPVNGCIDYASKPLATDQRGFPRVVGAVCDVGAFEYSPLSSNANLSALALSSGSLAPAFTGGTTGYTANVANSVTNLTVTPTLADASASLTVNGASVASGSASGAISLNVGSNTLTVVVTAQDGATTKSYTATVTRAASNFFVNLPSIMK